ncbi:MAG: GNAT family N-acetyltransferase [Rubrobacteraceae bacterium]|nr:GNAT family N-acetyltransferase [Rubrobacteraceae bacterium]
MVYASAPYLRLIEDQLPGSQPLHLGAFADERLVGVMPALLARDSHFGRVANSSPFYGSHGGAYSLLTGPERDLCLRSLLEAFRLTCRREGCITSNVVEPLGNRDEALYREVLEPWHTDQRTGQIVDDLSADDDEMMSRYHQKTRNMVRKATKTGVQVNVSTSPEAIEFLARVHGENMGAIGAKPKSPGFFSALTEQLRPTEDWAVYEASIGSQRVAALLVLRFGESTEYFTPVTSAEFRNAQPMSLIVHTAMLDAARLGYSRFNFGGTWTTAQEGVYRFKSRFGASDLPYTYYVSKYEQGEPFDGASRSDLMAAYDGYYLFPFEPESARAEA